MSNPPITDLLNLWADGDTAAGRDVFAELYDQLHELASIQVSRRRRNALVQTTMVLHEAYLKLDRKDNVWSDRNHFFAYSARTMRNVLLDIARQDASRKRGSGSTPLAVEDCLGMLAEPRDGSLDLDDVLTLNVALTALEQVDPERAGIVELRFFTGMSPAEIGEVLELSESTVARRLRSARAWLQRFLEARPLVP